MSVLIIAEIGVNHNGDMQLAKQLIKAAADAGADVAKFQSWQAEALAAPTAVKAAYQQRNDKESASQLEMLRKIELKRQDHASLQAYCQACGITFMSSSFGVDDSVFLAKELGCQQIKVGSGELTNGPMLLATARLGVDIILSTGMATLGDIDEALGIVAFGYLNPKASPSKAAFAEALASDKGQAVLKEKLILLHCTSEYPCPEEYINLNAMDVLRQRYGVRIGFSDHSSGSLAAIAAVAKGAVVIEKHVTIDRNLPGPDHLASVEIDVFSSLCARIRETEILLGSSEKTITAPERHTKEIVRKVVVARQAIKAGQIFTEDNLTTIRTATAGLPPNALWDLLHKPASKDYEPYEVI